MDPKNLSIQIYNNSNSKISMKVHYLKRETDRKKFLAMCSDVLKIKAQRVFDGGGIEIHDVNLIQEGGSYFISQGEDFCNLKYTTSHHEKKTVITYRVSLLGMGAVGKSNLTTRWVNNEFFEVYSNTLFDKYYKKASVGNQYTQVEISDTCGQEPYTSLRTQWMKDKEGLIFTYAINSRDSFEDVKSTLQLFEELFKQPEQAAQPIQVPSIVIVGNKVDLAEQREVSQAEGRQLAQAYKALYFETSAKSGQNVNEMFQALLEDIARRKQSKPQQNVAQLDQKEKSWCFLI